jgi:ATP phosphoribosyltransferase regulatory subunit
MAARGVEIGSLRFAADFVRSLDYYTGFVFEIRATEGPARQVLAAGGRYDGLLAHLGASAPAPGVGCSFWLDRLRGERP